MLLLKLYWYLKQVEVLTNFKSELIWSYPCDVPDFTYSPSGFIEKAYYPRLSKRVNRNLSDQKIVGNSLQPIGVIITGNLFIKAPC